MDRIRRARTDRQMRDTPARAYRRDSRAAADYATYSAHRIAGTIWWRRRLYIYPSLLARERIYALRAFPALLHRSSPISLLAARSHPVICVRVRACLSIRALCRFCRGAADRYAQCARAHCTLHARRTYARRNALDPRTCARARAAIKFSRLSLRQSRAWYNLRPDIYVA